MALLNVFVISKNSIVIEQGYRLSFKKWMTFSKEQTTLNPTLPLTSKDQKI
jgi:hypothetical protein